MTNSFRIVSDEEGARLDVFLSERLNLTRSKVQDMVGLGSVRANGAIPKPSLKVRRSMVIEGEIPEERPPELMPEEIPLQVLYEDDYLIAIDKPAGMVVHPSAGHAGGTLVNALLAHLGGKCEKRNVKRGPIEPVERLSDPQFAIRNSQSSSVRPEAPSLRGSVPPSAALRPGIVHRLDKGTTGVILVAKDATTQELLSRLFKDRAMAKTYRAVVEGIVVRDTGLVEGNIGRHPVDRKRMAVLKARGRTAATSYRVLRRLKGFTYVEAYPATGRTHQIRVHLAHIGHPVVGDETYGRKARTLTPRPLLHAYRLTFEHPRTRRNLVLEAPVPRDIEEFLAEHEIQS